MTLSTNPPEAPAAKRLPPLDAVFVLPVNHAAVAAGLSRATIYRLIKEGKLRSIKVAGRRLIPKAEIESLVTKSA